RTTDADGPANSTQARDERTGNRGTGCGQPVGRVLGGAATRPVLLDATDADARGASRGPLSPNEGRRRALSIAGAGSRRRRKRVCARATRRPVTADPQSRVDARERRDAGRNPA